MTTTPVLIPVEEYLRTVYRPDRDYINGEVIERNMGETPHSGLQAFFAFFFRLHDEDWDIRVLTEQRLYINPTCYRIPDVMVTSVTTPYEPRIVHTPPLLCIEVLSSGDRLSEVQKRIDGYASIGVKSTWVADPWRGVAYTNGPKDKLVPVEDVLTVEGTQISITLAEIWAELNRLERRAARQISNE